MPEFSMKVLILEDELVTAFDLQLIVEDAGHEVEGPFGTVASAHDAAAGVDFALLDIDLPDGKSFPLAERLNAAGTPFAFLSGSWRSDLPAELRTVPFLSKPCSEAAIRNLLAPARSLAS